MRAVNRGFTGIPSFLRARIAETPADYAGAKIGVLGVPFDEGSPFLPGSRMGPRALREHSLRFPVNGSFYDPDTGRTFLGPEMTRGLLVDCGDVDIRPANPARTFELIEARVREMLEAGLLPVILGGDHSIEFPVFQAFAALGRPLHVIQFDAHQDFSPIDDELNRTNGQGFRHVSRMAHCASITQVGIRGFRTTQALVEEMRALGNRVVTMSQVRALGPEGIAALLPEGSDVYVSIDVDALDMSLIPGCVSGEPDGMGFRALMESLRAVAERHHVHGFDFVEVNPALDVATGATSYLGTLIVTEFLGHICNQPRWAARRDG